MRVTITAAKRACEAVGARQVVLVAFDGTGRFACASYGETKAECAEVAGTCDAVYEALRDGDLPGPGGDCIPHPKGMANQVLAARVHEVAAYVGVDHRSAAVALDMLGGSARATAAGAARAWTALREVRRHLAAANSAGAAGAVDLALAPRAEDDELVDAATDAAGKAWREHGDFERVARAVLAAVGLSRTGDVPDDGGR